MNIHDKGRKLVEQEAAKLKEQFKPLEDILQQDDKALEKLDQLMHKAEKDAQNAVAEEIKVKPTEAEKMNIPDKGRELDKNSHVYDLLAEHSEGWRGMREREGFPTLPESQGSWRWLLILGVGLILFGVVELGSVVVLELLAIVVLGPLLMASGILQVLLAFFARRPKEAPLHLGAAALDFVIGVLVLFHPRNTVDDLILVLAAFLMVGGVSRILSSLFLRFRAWGWLVSAGIVAVILGLIIWKEGSFRGLWLVAVCVAVDFIAHGLSWVVLSHSSRESSPITPNDDPTRFRAERDERKPLDLPTDRTR